MTYLPHPLSAQYEGSFAYNTIRDRLPVILTKSIDYLSRNRETCLGSRFIDSSSEIQKEAYEQVRGVIGELSSLKYEIQTNKQFKILEDQDDDSDLWNTLICKKTKTGIESWDKSFHGSDLLWFDVPWLYAECYMYRRIQSAISKRPLLRGFDIFHAQKEESYRKSLPAIVIMIEHMNELRILCEEEEPFSKKIEIEFNQMLQLCLWGNKCDLSISAGENVVTSFSPIEEIHLLESKIIADDSTKIWDKLVTTRTEVDEDQDSEPISLAKRVRLDIMLDNAGYELFMDFCFADFLVMCGLVDDVFFHCKCYPWFVSDAIRKDFYWVLEQSVHLAKHKVMAEAQNGERRTNRDNDDTEGEQINTFVGSTSNQTIEDTSNPVGDWLSRLSEGQWFLVEDVFWTTPYDFTQMKKIAPALYEFLTDSHLIVFKGDLNYRKLIGDLDWIPTTTFKESLRKFCPAPIVALRTLKADVCVGLNVGEAEYLQQNDSNWMVSGDYAVIQYQTKMEEPEQVDSAMSTHATPQTDSTTRT